MADVSLWRKALYGVGSRMVAAASNRSYVGADTSRNRVQRAWFRSKSGDEESALSAYDRKTMMLECIDLYRNHPLAHGIVNRYADYSVYTGVNPTPRTSSAEWNKEAGLWWREYYAPLCDYRRRAGVDMRAFQRMAVISSFYAGDMGFTLMDDGRLFPIEGERIATPSGKDTEAGTRDGIKRDTSTGQILGYYVLMRTKDGHVNPEEWEYIERDNMIFVVSESFRPDMVRGVPRMSAAVAKLRHLEEIDEAMLGKLKHEAKQFLKVKKETHGLANDRVPTLPLSTDAATGKQMQRITETSTGQIWDLLPNEDVDGFDIRTPGNDYVPFKTDEVKEVAACFGMPYEVFMLIFTAGSFTAQRAASLHAQHSFDMEHERLTRQFCQRLWNWRIAKAMKRGEIGRAPVDRRGISEWYKTTWSVPYYGFVRPQEEMASYRDAWNLGVGSITDFNESMGQSRDDIFANKADDMVAAIEKAREVNERAGEQIVTWRDFIMATNAVSAFIPPEQMIPAPERIPAQ